MIHNDSVKLSHWAHHCASAKCICIVSAFVSCECVCCWIFLANSNSWTQWTQHTLGWLCAILISYWHTTCWSPLALVYLSTRSELKKWHKFWVLLVAHRDFGRTCVYRRHYNLYIHNHRLSFAKSLLIRTHNLFHCFSFVSTLPCFVSFCDSLNE